MKCRLFIALLPILFLNCKGKSQSASQKELTCLRVTKIFPMPSMTKPGKVEGYDTSVAEFYFYGDIRAYRLTHFNTSDKNRNGFPVYQYLIHQKDSAYGRLFDSTLKLYNVRLKVNNVTSALKMTDVRLQYAFDSMNVKLLSSKVNKDSGTLHEQYSFVHKRDDTEKGIISLSYSNNFDDVPFHLSAYIDSIKGTKLNYYKMLSIGGKVQGLEIIQDDLTAVVFIQKIVPPDRFTVMKYINLYAEANP